MPFREVSLMEEKERFCKLVVDSGVSVARASRAYGISRQTGYLVLARYLEEGRDGLEPRSHRPHSSPNRIAGALEEQVIRTRHEHPAWGARKLAAYLLAQGVECPKTTIGRVLKRNGLIDPVEAAKHKAYKRIETSGPNEIWQMDFTDFRLMSQDVHSHVLVILDDASRYVLKLGAYGDERRETVEEALRGVFRTCGLPKAILTDNGAPWGSCGNGEGYTKLNVWLIRLNIKPVHARSYHPQTIGKVERFNRTLKKELGLDSFSDLGEGQRALDDYLEVYNFKRPHTSLKDEPPANLYRPSPRPYPEILEEVDYDSGYLVRKVDANGDIYLKNRSFRVGKAFTGLRVGLMAIAEDEYEVYFMRERVAKVSLSPDT